MIYRVKEYVKAHKWIYRLYFHIMSFGVNILKLLVQPDEKLILFVSYGGKHYSDSPKNIFEMMLDDARFSDYKFVWAFVDPNKFEIGGAKKIKIDTISYFVTALKARVWITNVIIERALNFRGKNTYYLCTSHGIPLKGKKEDGGSFQVDYPCLYDCILAQSEFDKAIQQVEFNIPSSKIRLLGYPRNDKFAGNREEIITKVRTFYEIDNNKKIILYAPTYRDWNNGTERTNLNIKKWEKLLGDRFTLLFRAHPTVKIDGALQNTTFFKNATQYEDLDELLIAADLLISDYSSLFFDYSIMHKPMICWAYDYDTFSKYRELRVDLINEVYGGQITEDDLLSIIDSENYDKAIEMAIKFQRKYVTVYGVATQNTIDLIYSKIHDVDCCEH